MTFVCSNIGVNAENHLTFAGQDTLRLAEEYGTPLYLMDEDRIRHNCRLYLDAFRNTFREGSLPHYAAKAAAFKTVCRVVAEEGMGIDVCSPGEIATAVAAGVDMSRVMFPSNGKSDGDIRYAMDKGIGAFVIDNVEELLVIEAEAEVPQAISAALREGKLGVMDYYNMKNVMSDTEMRAAIGKSAAPASDKKGN